MDQNRAELVAKLVNARNYLEEAARVARAQGRPDYSKGLRRGWDMAAEALGFTPADLGFTEEAD